MIKREDFNGKKYDEMAIALQADLVMYAEQVASLETIEDCSAEEQKLMEAMKEIEARLDTIEYDLPHEVVYEGKKYSKKDIATKVIYFLNKIECKWEQTLGLHQLVKLWKGEDFNAIPYRVYDSTLRCLNTVSFKGDSEWIDILAVNEYLSLCHNEYSLDTGMLVYISEMHNLVMDRMKELDPNSQVPEQMN